MTEGVYYHQEKCRKCGWRFYTDCITEDHWCARCGANFIDPSKNYKDLEGAEDDEVGFYVKGKPKKL